MLRAHSQLPWHPNCYYASKNAQLSHSMHVCMHKWIKESKECDIYEKIICQNAGKRWRKQSETLKDLY